MIRQRNVAALAIVGTLLAARVASATTLIVDDDRRQCPGAFYQTISAAVDAASDNDTIHVCSGTYTEQVVITKSLRVVGDAGAVIRPSALPTSVSSFSSDRPVTGGIIVDAPHILLSSLTVDLSNADISGCMVLLAGVYLRNASGLVDSLHVTGVNVPDAPTCDSGVGLFVESAVTGVSSTVPSLGKARIKIKDGLFEACQKGGIVANGPNTNVRIAGSKLVGDGSAASAIQNGLQIGLGARATITRIKVSNYASTVSTQTATGVLLWKPAHVLLRGSSISDSQTGIFVVGAGVLQGNNIQNVSSDGIVFLGDGNTALTDTVNGAGVSGIFVDGNNNRIRFGSLANMPIALWFHAGTHNTYANIQFDPSIPLHGQGVFGGTRNLTENSVEPFLAACRGDSDCDDGDACTTDACDVTTGACTHLPMSCGDGNSCTSDGCVAGAC